MPSITELNSYIIKKKSSNPPPSFNYPWPALQLSSVHTFSELTTVLEWDGHEYARDFADKSQGDISPLDYVVFESMFSSLYLMT